MNSKELYEYQKYRWIKRKYDAIDYLGGSCHKCGGTFPRGCYDFHHKDPSTKEASWQKMRMWSWDRIIEELDKCALLCANCHRLEHTHDLSEDELSSYFHEMKTRRLVERVEVLCPTCNTLFKSVGGKQKHCSFHCASKANRKIEMSDEEVYDLLVENNYNYCETGRKIGLSDNGVRKRVKKVCGGIAPKKPR